MVGTIDAGRACRVFHRGTSIGCRLDYEYNVIIQLMIRWKHHSSGGESSGDLFVVHVFAEVRYAIRVFGPENFERFSTYISLAQA